MSEKMPERPTILHVKKKCEECGKLHWKHINNKRIKRFCSERCRQERNRKDNTDALATLQPGQQEGKDGA